jgi:hypothetical protein
MHWQYYALRMPKHPSQSSYQPQSKYQSSAKQANSKGEKLTAKHGKTEAHKPVERRVSNKGRG